MVLDHFAGVETCIQSIHKLNYRMAVLHSVDNIMLYIVDLAQKIIA